MKKIMFCGGGSAGHVIPNIAVMEVLNGIYELCYLGTDGIEKRICAENKVKYYECSAVKFVRGKILCNLALPFKLFKSVKEAGKIIDEVKPDLIFCKGGYACVPPALAAKKRNIPVITHESDVSAGLANKFIAKRCEKVLTTFPSTAKKFDRGICTGTPMRGCLFGRSRSEAHARFGLDMRPTLVVLGGGSGSKKINAHIRNIAPKVCKDITILHICRKGNIK
ncbi:MAG: glycosyltransferase, partial [Clostridia bacterium]|nr:glycosyltransferase [Clostridia bacterium]